MIHEILASDVELARSLIAANHSDAEILAQLASRGVESAKATGLLDDLRHGRRPSTQLPIPPGSDGYHHSRKRRAAPAVAPQTLDPPRRRSHRGSHGPSGVPWWFVLLALVFIGALAYAFWQMGLQATGEAVIQDRHEIPAAPGK
jgi:hypothetical protein